MSVDTSTAILERRSIRRYKPDQVPDDLLREILAEARWAPSAVNTQSTFVYALSGEPLQKFKAELRGCAESEAKPNPDILPGDVPPEHATRRQDLFKARTTFVAAEEAKMGIKPPDEPINPMVAGAAIFEAPTVLVLTFDASMSEGYGCFDAGLFTMCIALSAHARGLGTCITSSNVRFPDLLRKVIPGAEKQKIVAAIALGYPDWEMPVNRFPRARIPVDDFLTFVR
ncbi:MAG: nitroreductase [Thermoleophilia bacterium]